LGLDNFRETLGEWKGGATVTRVVEFKDTLVEGVEVFRLGTWRTADAAYGNHKRNGQQELWSPPSRPKCVMGKA
jgi:predicted nicotinamide N-methyase